MSCLNPMLILKTDFSSMPGKEFFVRYHYWKDKGFQVDKNKQIIYKILHKSSRDLPLDKILEEYDLLNTNSSILEVPCRNCLGCRIDYSTEWANRCFIECKKYEFNYFITLTYDPDSAKKGSIGNDSLSKEDFDNFIHSLKEFLRRKFHHIGMKYFGCGEYGETTWRPHYHILLMNCPILDLTELFPSTISGSYIKKLDSLGVAMKYSPKIASLWNKGIITIQEANWNSGQYIAKYVLKKQVGESSIIYEKLGVLPPFLRMSRGIAKDYISEHIDSLFDNPSLIHARDHKEPLITGIPRFFKKELKKIDPVRYEKLIESSERFLEDKRSLIKGKQEINKNRSIKEDRLLHNTSKVRDF